jgi:hypothetical protein
VGAQRRLGPRLGGLALHFDIDAHGRLVPVSDDVRGALGDRAGRFLLLPSVPDLLVARRLPSSGGTASGPRCVLAGDISAFPIADFLGFLHSSRLSGTLTVSSGGVDRSVVFKAGEVRGAQSVAPGERIGEVGQRLGFLRPEQLAQASAEAAGRPFGKVLVDKGFITAANLWKCFHEQVTSVFHAILMAREGVFALVDQAELELPGTPLAVNTQQLLMDGIRRIDELGLFRSRIPGPTAYLRRREPRRPVALKPLEEQLLALVDGRRRLSDIASAAHLSEFDATKVLFHLAEAGYVEAAPDPVAESARGDPNRVAEIIGGMNAIYREVAVHVAAARGLEPFLAALRGFMGDAGSRYAPVWQGLLPGRDASLDPAALAARVGSLRGAALQRIEPGGDLALLLFDAMRELLFFMLFQAGERLSRDADESLSAEVKRRLEALGGLR